MKRDGEVPFREIPAWVRLLIACGLMAFYGAVVFVYAIYLGYIKP